MLVSSRVFGGDFVINQDVRLKAAGSGVRLWQVAEALGMRDDAFSKKLRRELSKEEKQKIFDIIDRLSRGGA